MKTNRIHETLSINFEVYVPERISTITVILSDQIDGIPFLILCFSVLLVLNLVGLHRNSSASYIWIWSIRNSTQKVWNLSIRNEFMLKFSRYMLCDSLIKSHLGETHMHPRYKGLGFPPSKSPRNPVMSIDNFQQTKPNI